MNRFRGRLQGWNDQGSYGFLRPLDGGQDIFVHGSGLPSPRPEPEEILTFAVALNGEGKKKAVDVRRESVEAEGLVADRDRRAKPQERVTRYQERRTGRWASAIAAIALGAALFAIATGAWRPPARFYRTSEAASVPSAAKVASPFSCDGRTMCSQMTSCTEATWFLKNCPGTKMDGNNDGVPCERQWCH